MVDVVILTDERYVSDTEDSEYSKNVMTEDQLVMTELIIRGLTVKKVAWSDPNFDWSSTQYALFRTTWDYSERFGEFADWLMEVSTKTKLINSYELVSWNLDKHYLMDLERAGIRIVETHFIEQQDARTLQQIHQELGWEKTVLKPCISASAKDTYKLSSEAIAAHEERFRTLVMEEPMMLQPFQNSVVERGEVSLMMVNGEHTHSVLKMAKPGDFRVQDDFGGSVHDYSATLDEIELAKKTVRACDSLPIYARVDMITDNDGQLAVTEIELVEPEMWFRKAPNAARQLAEAIKGLF